MTTELEERIKALIPKMEGWCSVDKALDMAQLILDTKPRVIVELGVFGGRSLVPQAMALREVGVKDPFMDGRIYGVDPWQIEPAVEGETEENKQWWQKDCPLPVIHDLCMKAIWDEHLEPWAIIIQARAEHVAHLFKDGIDILHFDQNHSELASVRDIQIYLPLVKPGGYIWFDDSDWTGTQKALGIVRDASSEVKDLGKYKLFKKHELKNSEVGSQVCVDDEKALPPVQEDLREYAKGRKRRIQETVGR